MLKFKHDREAKEFYLEAKGSADELFADIILLIEELYKNMKKNHPEDAETLRNAFKKAIAEDVPFVDEVERIKMINKKLNDLLEGILCS